MPEWEWAMKALELSKFHHGDNDRGWRATIDFLLRPSQRASWIEQGEALRQRQRGPEITRRCGCGGIAQKGAALCYKCLSEKAGVAK